MRLTSRGWTLAGAALGLYVGGRILGTVELSMLAAGALTALAAGAVIALVGRVQVQAVRRLHPQRLYAGTPARAEVVVENRGHRRTPVLAVTDRFTGRREVRFAVSPLHAGDSARGAYRLPSMPRGVYEVGPLDIAVTDPLGLVRRPVRTDAREPVTVYPRIESVHALPLTVGRDLVGGAVRDFSRSRSGEEFHGLREYAMGDDLRRVHWRSTARTGQLMIREHDVPWQTRATLVLDDRTGVARPADFERMVEATASVATALQQRRSILRLLTTAAGETGWGVGHEHHRALMERLAVVHASPEGRFSPLANRLHRQAGSGALLVFTGEADDEQLTILASLGRRFGFVAVVRCLGRAGTARAAPPGEVVLVDVPPGRRFADAWNEAMVVRFGAGRRASAWRGSR